MTTLHATAPIAVYPSVTVPQRSGPITRALRALVVAMAETNRRRAEREIARVARTYSLGIDDRA